MSTAASPKLAFPPLQVWAEERLTALITAKSQADFDSDFDSFVSKHIKTITFNGESLTRAQYKEKLQRERSVHATATIDIRDVVDVPQFNIDVSDSGLVGLFYRATYTEGIKIHDVSTKHSVLSSLNVHVSEDQSIPLSNGPLQPDRRRVDSINQVYLDIQGTLQPSS